MAAINSFDQVGKLHNEMLDYLININTTPTYTEFETSCVQFISEYVDNDRPIFKDAIKTMIAEIYNVEYMYPAIGYTLETKILNGFNANGEQLKFLNRLLEPLPDPLSNHFENIQNDLIQSSMMIHEKAPLLASVSIALHSLEYWEAAKNDTNNPWYLDWVPSIAVGNTARKDYMFFLSFAALPVAVAILNHYLDGDGIDERKLSHMWRAGILFAGVAGAVRSASAVFFGE